MANSLSRINQTNNDPEYWKGATNCLTAVEGAELNKESAEYIHNVVRSSCALSVVENALDPLRDAIATITPEIDGLVKDRNAQVIDYDSYRRRVKAIREKKEGMEVSVRPTGLGATLVDSQCCDPHRLKERLALQPMQKPNKNWRSLKAKSKLLRKDTNSKMETPRRRFWMPAFATTFFSTTCWSTLWSHNMKCTLALLLRWNELFLDFQKTRYMLFDPCVLKLFLHTVFVFRSLKRVLVSRKRSRRAETSPKHLKKRALLQKVWLLSPEKRFLLISRRPRRQTQRL